MKTGQWTLVGVNKADQDKCVKHAAKHAMSVAAYLEHILAQDLKIRKSCEKIEPIHQITETAELSLQS